MTNGFLSLAPAAESGKLLSQELTEAQLVLQYRSLGKKHAFSHLSNVQHLQFDLTKVEELARLLDELHDIDIFIHCVSAPISMKDLERKDWTDFQTHLNVQLKSFFLIFRRVVQGMRQKRWGRIIPIVSQEVVGKPTARMADYVAAKFALLGLARCIAQAYGSQNITCNCVSPGLVETELTAGIPDKAKEFAAYETPLKRLTRPKDVASMVRFLCSETSEMVNGQNLIVDGGRIMK